MTLIATWKPSQDPAVDQPVSVQWSDGTPATLADYARHLADTSASTCALDGSVTLTMYPDVTASVRFDHALGRWICEAPHRRVILELADPEIADDQIIAELSTYEIFYRTTVIRPEKRGE
jgi:hypothetical protein